MDPLLTTLLDLDWQLGGNADLCVGGGFGLFLKQRYLRSHPEMRTLFPLGVMPEARTTEDIDLFLRADVVADAQRMAQIRRALDQLGFVVVEAAKFMQFIRPVATGSVKLDLLVGPLGDFQSRMSADSRRARPHKKVGLHARRVDEAMGIEVHPLVLPISGHLTSGAEHSTTIRIPQSFTYLLMKLVAFRDRHRDPDKALGQHHALDLYRIVGLMTQAEDAGVRELSQRYREHPHVVEIRRIVREHFRHEDSLGLLRIREHPLCSANMLLDAFRRELQVLFPPV